MFWCVFYFHVYRFILFLSAVRGVSPIRIENVHTKLSKYCIFETSIKYMVYSALSTMSGISYLIISICICMSKEKLKWEPLCLWNRKRFINLHRPIRNVFSFVVFYFSLFLRCFGKETVFAVTSCQGWLGLSISSKGQEAVWFFSCSTIIRPPLSLLGKCDAKHLKVLSPMIKDSSLSVASLCLIQAPTEQCVQPKEKTQLSPKRGSAVFMFHVPDTPEMECRILLLILV